MLAGAAITALLPPINAHPRSRHTGGGNALLDGLEGPDIQARGSPGTLDRTRPSRHQDSMSWTIGQLTIDGPAVLAPLAGFSDVAFRPLCREQGAAVVFTEMVSAEGLLRGVRSTTDLMTVDESERPLGLQLYGADPERLGQAAALAWEMARPDLIDLNMGCPARKVIRKGAGVALMNDPPRAIRVVEAVRRAVPCPVSVKLRSGWSADRVNAVELAPLLQRAGCDALVVHGRIRTQGHSGAVDHDLIARVRDAVTIPVIGNGGVTDGASARAMMDAAGVEAVMVGRGAIGNPWVFRIIGDELSGRPLRPVSARELRAAVERHLDGLIALRRAARMVDAEARACSRFRGHLVRYVSGRRGSTAFRRRLMELVTRDAVLRAVDGLLAVDDAGAT